MSERVADPGPVVLLTGMSGAGKGLAARAFEDMGWQVVDNLPPCLVPQAVEARHGALCMVCDTRSGETDAILPALARLDPPARLVFLDATDDELIKRFKETRRSHPLFDQTQGILPAIQRERGALEALKGCADLVVDTTLLAPSDLRTFLRARFGGISQQLQPLTVTVASFGFKHGIPLDADLVFDVRFLRNPHYEPTLRDKDGRDPEVDAYVMEDDRTDCVLERLFDLVGWSLPHYVQEGKAYLTVAIGCTGGQHRSVVVAERLARFVAERGYPVLTQHRDAERTR